MRCKGCLGESEGDWHPRCARELFGQRTVPHVGFDLASLHRVGLAMVGRSSLSGTQRKLALGLDGGELTVSARRLRWILKPQANAWPNLPENEHVTLRIAAAFGLDVPPCGLVALRDGSLAFVAERFDRPADGSKRAQEDFCQLAGVPPKEKYEGSAELCVRLVKRYATEPMIAVQALFRLLVFAWWTGNGDMHLKNFSLLDDGEGRMRLAPAYDLLCTRLVIPKDPLALPIGGKKDRLARATWLGLAAYADIPVPAAERILALPAQTLDAALALVAASYLPDDLKKAYAALLSARARPR